MAAGRYRVNWRTIDGAMINSRAPRDARRGNGGADGRENDSVDEKTEGNPAVSDSITLTLDNDHICERSLVDRSFPTTRCRYVTAIDVSADASRRRECLTVLQNNEKYSSASFFPFQLSFGWQCNLNVTFLYSSKAHILQSCVFYLSPMYISNNGR